MYGRDAAPTWMGAVASSWLWLTSGCSTFFFAPHSSFFLSASDMVEAEAVVVSPGALGAPIIAFTASEK